MTTITKDTISTTVWDNIYNLLQTGTYALSTDNIFSAYNSKLVKDQGYPIVVIYPPSISFKKESMNYNYEKSDIVLMIEVYEDNAQDLKTLVDSVMSKLRGGRVVLKSVNLGNMSIGPTDYDSWIDGNKKIHRMTFDVTFRYIG